MKKVLAFVLVIFMTGVLLGCGTSTPEDTVAKFFNSVKRFNIEGIDNTLVEGKSEEIVDPKLFEGFDKSSVFTELIIDNMKKFSHKVTDSVVEGDKAVVSVSCKYVDSGPLLKATFGEYIAKVFGNAFSGEEMSNDNMEKMLSDIIKKQKKKIPVTVKDVDLKIDLVKIDGEWLIADVNDDLLDVVLSGMYSVFNEFGESFK